MMAESSGLILSLPAYVFPALMIAAGAGDALTMRIPNWLTGLVAVAFLPAALAAGMTPLAAAMHAACGAAVLLAGFLLFSLGLIGGGDAKLMAAAALWFGYPQVVAFLLYTSLAGGVLALCAVIWALIRWQASIWGLSRGPPLNTLRPEIPYGLAIAAGAVVAWAGTGHGLPEAGGYG